MKCYKCEAKSPKHSLFRVNKKGEKGVWACWKHQNANTELKQIVKAIENNDVR